MNRQYRERHGFPFIICVRHHTASTIPMGDYPALRAALSRREQAASAAPPVGAAVRRSDLSRN
ncbi:2-oxo-4-hydroxy-4-carboxy-5-ureidoimidazoline decarboxylase [Pseudomonas guariconensis]|uniref:2-oxo-4-hydroxy-4-carboxy-5-ureidoimidazoline decarboxylase n=1 Tax=Pseudomonas guariconensis TaxID=1288410 RepID=UPI003AF31E87